MGRGQASGGNFVEYLPSVKTGYAALRTHLGNRRRFGNPHPPPVGGRLGHQGSQGHGARAPVARAEAAAPRAADAPSQTPSARGQEGRLGSRAPPRPVGPAAAGQAPPRTDGRTGGRAAAGASAVVPDMLLSGRISNPGPQARLPRPGRPQQQAVARLSLAGRRVGVC